MLALLLLCNLKKVSVIVAIFFVKSFNVALHERNGLAIRREVKGAILLKPVPTSAIKGSFTSLFGWFILYWIREMFLV